MRYYLFLMILMVSTVSSAQKKAGYRLKVMSYNIHHANPPSKPGIIDLDAIVAVIKSENPDLVALQEVDVNTQRSGRLNQAVTIAQKLRMNFVFGKAIDYDGGEYGLVILSKYPISNTAIHKLPADSAHESEPRIFLTANVSLPKGREVRFGNTHLDSGNDPINRNMQINEVNRLSQEESHPFIIAGDFNADAGSEAIRILNKQFKKTCEPCQPTFPVEKPQTAIDFIAVNSGTRFRVIDHKVLNEHYASDHLPVVAVLELE